MGTKLGPNMYFVNKQLTDITKKFKTADAFLAIFPKPAISILFKISENVCLTQTIKNCLRNQQALNFLLISVSCLFTKYIFGPSFVPVQDTEMLGPSTRSS